MRVYLCLSLRQHTRIWRILDIKDIKRDLAFCLHTDDALSSSWAEIYDGFGLCLECAKIIRILPGPCALRALRRVVVVAKIGTATKIRKAGTLAISSNMSFVKVSP